MKVNISGEHTQIRLKIELTIEEPDIAKDYLCFLNVCQEKGGMTLDEFHTLLLQLGLREIGRMNPKKSTRKIAKEIQNTVGPDGKHTTI